MPAASKAQQRFMGMVHAADKGETPASPEVAKVSADMKDSDAKDFASTSHDGLPDHVKEQLKSVVREVIREKSGMNEMSSNDVHFKHIMKLYDRGGSFTRKKIGAVICKDPKASRKDVEEELFDADYRDILEFEDELGLKEIREKYSSVKEDAAELPPATIPAAVKAKLQLAIDKIKDSKLSNNAKLQLLAQVIDAIGIDKSQLSTIASKIRSKMESVVTEEFKHLIHVDTPTQVVSKPVAAQIMALAKKGVRASEIGLEMGFVGNAKLAADTFQKVKNKIYFELDKRNESINEAMGNDKSMLALVDMLSNSMEHYSTESEFATVASKIAGFGKLKSLFKDVYNKYWDLGAKERNDWHTKDWLNWLKKWSLEESINEAAFKSPDYIVTSVPASSIPQTNISKADVGLGLSMGDEFGMYSTLNNKHYKLDYHNGKVALVLSKVGKLAVKVRSEIDPKYLAKIEKFVNDYLTKFANGIKKKESVNEAKPSVVGNMNASGPSKVLGKGGKVLGFVPDTPNAIATLIQDYPNVQAIEFKSPFFFDFNSYKSIKKGDKAWKELMSRSVDNPTKAALKKDFQLKESVTEEHDCGCNENHDCGCGGLHEHHINEDISADANGIAGLTASRANAVKDFLEKNNINSNKLYLFLKKGNLKDRMDFVTALVGKPGNPIQKKVIKQFSN